MEQDKLIEKIKAKLYRHRVAAPSQLWQRIAANLPKQSPKSPIVYRRWYFSVAAVAAVLLIVVSVVFHFEPSHNASQEMLAVVADTAQTSHPDLLPLETPHTAALSVVTTQRTAPVAKSKKTLAQWCEQVEGSVNNAVVVNCEASHLDSTLLAMNHDVAPDTLPLIESDVAAIDMEREDSIIECLDNQLLLVDCDVAQYIMNCRNVANEPDLWLSIEANTSFSQTTVAPFPLRGGNDELIFEHSMPLNAEVLVEKKFGDWGVGLGFSYTYLFSEYQMTDNLRKGSQELHYVGIPLYVSYEFAHINRFSFYVSLGGEIDFNNKGIQKEKPESAYYNSCARSEFYDAQPQLSVQGAVGAAFSILPNPDLYLEPTLAYYFRNGSDVHNIWHDAPLNLSVSFGLRAGF